MDDNRKAIALLRRVVDIADQAINPPARVTVPLATLRELAHEIELARLTGEHGGIIDDEVAMLLQCLIKAEVFRLHAAGENADPRYARLAARWRILAQAFLPMVRTDYACALAASWEPAERLAAR